MSSRSKKVGQRRRAFVFTGLAPLVLIAAMYAVFERSDSLQSSLPERFHLGILRYDGQVRMEQGFEGLVPTLRPKNDIALDILKNTSIDIDYRTSIRTSESELLNVTINTLSSSSLNLAEVESEALSTGVKLTEVGHRLGSWRWMVSADKPGEYLVVLKFNNKKVAKNGSVNYLGSIVLHLEVDNAIGFSERTEAETEAMLALIALLISVKAYPYILAIFFAGTDAKE